MTSCAGRVRVGRCTYTRTGERVDPVEPGFTPIVVLMKSHSKWGVLGPYELQDPHTNVILENLWQFSKVYADVPRSEQKKSRWDPSVIWAHPAERHVVQDDAKNVRLSPQYFAWRAKGFACSQAIRYPVGFDGRHKCLFALAPAAAASLSDSLLPDGKNVLIPPSVQLDYIAARKEIYVPEYTRLVKLHPLFQELVNRVRRGENLLIIEVDGPHEESMAYYKTTYGVPDSFIERQSVEATRFNLGILLRDPTHPYGHGYCLADALL